LRSDEQLVALFRAGHDDAFRAIHDRYRQRLFAYTRQMLPARQDAEDALQDVFVRAYSGLRTCQGQLVLRAWLYRIAHNRCIDELRRPAPPPPEVLELVRTPSVDPIAAADQRESLRRLVIDVRRLPEQQRSALLMRELGGMAYADMADALGVSVPAVKSLLVRARIALAQALEARDTACSDIRGQLTLAHDRGVRPSGTARRHMRDCSHCRHFHGELRGVSRRFAALAPTVGPMGVIAKVLGVGGGGGAAASSGAVAAGGAAGTGAVASVGLFATGAGHIATLIAAAAVTAGGAVEIQSSITVPAHHVRHARPAATAPARSTHPEPTVATSQAAAATKSTRQVAVVPARKISTARPPARHKQVRHRQRVPAGHITDPALQSPASTTTGATDGSGATSTTDGSGQSGGSLDQTSSGNGKPSTTSSSTSGPTTALDQSSTTAPSTANGSPQTTSTGTTSSSVPTVAPATTNTTTSGSSTSSTSASGNGA
jgi:RNA polymerase sigma factor (sigma-70 family)